MDWAPLARLPGRRNPIFFGEPYAPHVYLSPQKGQFADHLGVPMDAQKFKSFGNTPEIWAAGGSIMNFVFNVPDTANPGRGRIQMKPTGELAHMVAPDTVVPAPGFDNFYYPWCPNGLVGVSRYYRIRYPEIFDHVDLDLYSTPSGMRMAIVCHPGFDPNSIYFAFEGQDSLDVDVQGALRAHMSGKTLRLEEAVAYQVDQNDVQTELPWGGTWQEAGGIGTARILFGPFDAHHTVVLQVGPPPMAAGGNDNLSEGLDWSTSFGDDNSGSIEGDLMGGATAAPNGDLLVAIAHGQGTFPPVPGWTTGYDQFQTCVGRYKYAPGNPNADAEQSYMTHFGGNDNTKPNTLSMNGNGTAVYVGGYTRVALLPVQPSTDPMDATYWEDTRKGASDGFIMKLDPADGTVLRFSYFGGGGDDAITALVEDEEGNIWFSGITTSNMGAQEDCNSPESAFPLCDPPGANYWQPTNAGGRDAFVARLDPDFKLTLSTFYGGPDNDIPYDMAYMPNPITAYRRVALVGRSLGTVPQNSTGAFHLNGISGQKAGFIATFDFGGGLQWSTNLQKLNSLQSVALRGNLLVVLGYCHSVDAGSLTNDGAEGGVEIHAGCTAEPGYLSICDPGGNAYHDANAESTDDLYIAEYDPIQGTLEWSSYVGGNTWEYPGMWFQQLIGVTYGDAFQFRKIADLQVDHEGNIWAMATTVNGAGTWQTYPTQPATPFYYKEQDASAGFFQSDITLHLFRPDRSLFYGSLFGAYHPHVDDPTYDYYFLNFGSDLGRDLALVEGAIYWTGTTGNNRFPTQCPYPGISYCEPFAPGNLRYVQAFATRMDLQDVSIGLNDPQRPGPAGLAVWPSPAISELNLLHQGLPLASGLLRITDATGRLIMERAIVNSTVALDGIANGVYHAQVQNRMGRVLGATSFVIAR